MGEITRIAYLPDLSRALLTATPAEAKPRERCFPCRFHREGRQQRQEATGSDRERRDRSGSGAEAVFPGSWRAIWCGRRAAAAAGAAGNPSAVATVTADRHRPRTGARRHGRTAVAAVAAVAERCRAAVTAVTADTTLGQTDALATVTTGTGGTGPRVTAPTAGAARTVPIARRNTTCNTGATVTSSAAVTAATTGTAGSVRADDVERGGRSTVTTGPAVAASGTTATTAHGHRQAL